MSEASREKDGESVLLSLLLIWSDCSVSRGGRFWRSWALGDNDTDASLRVEWFAGSPDIPCAVLLGF
jgi:hypothetical protein